MAMVESSGSLAREGIDLDEDSQIFHHHHQQQQPQQQQHPQQHPQQNLLLQLRHQHQQQKNYIFSHHLIDQHLQFGSRDGDRDRDSDRDGDGGGYGHSEQNQKLNGSGNGNETDNQKQNQKNFDSTCNLRELEDLLSKLNPLAEEFFPPSSASFSSYSLNEEGSQTNTKGGGRTRKKGNGPAPGKKRVSLRSSRAQQDDSIKRTVYVSDIDHQVTEEQLAALFITCGQVVDCRVCGDPNSVLRFAFVEFTDEEGARAALSLSGTMLGFYPVRVLPSKTAIVPVNPTFLPRSEDELEMCARTVYCANIDKKVSQTDVKLFFEMLCGEVARIRLLGDFHHSTRIAFVEFVMAESAIRALNCSGAILGSLPVRVSPSKTPVRPRSPRLL